MIWQDLLLMIGGFGFAIALIPSLRSKEKPSPKTSAITGGILLSFVVAYITLGLWLASIASIIVSGLWFALLIQSRRKDG